MKLRFLPMPALKQLRRIEIVVGTVAAIALALLALSFGLRWLDMQFPFAEELQFVDQALAVLSASLIATALMIRTAIMRNPAERIAPSATDDRTRDMLRKLVLDWAQARLREQAAAAGRAIGAD